MRNRICICGHKEMDHDRSDKCLLCLLNRNTDCLGFSPNITPFVFTPKYRYIAGMDDCVYDTKGAFQARKIAQCSDFRTALNICELLNKNEGELT